MAMEMRVRKSHLSWRELDINMKAEGAGIGKDFCNCI